MLFAEIAATTQQVAATSKRSDKVSALARLVRTATADEVEATVSFAVGEAPQGRIGVGWATLRDIEAPASTEPSLTVLDVVRAIDELATISGAGSVAGRRAVLARLLERATAPEQELVRAIVGGELRQGALDGVMTAAVAEAVGVKVADVRRATMFAGSLSTAARVAVESGVAGLAAVELTPLRPVQPMLASSAPDVDHAIADTGLSSVEWKLDGARVQAHRSGGVVRVFTRNLNDVTERLDGVVEAVRALPGGDLVLDGEVLGVDESGAPRPFQVTMGDFGADAASAAGEPSRGSALQVFFFDVLHHERSLVDEPLSVRRETLVELVPERHRLPTTVTDDALVARRCFDEAIAAGHEGVMIKRIDAPYEAGRRGGSWRKVKPVHTLDLVVLAVEWGHGRRRGWLSNLHLGARGTDGSFVMVGKTFKGLTDELLRWQTERFVDLAVEPAAGGERGVVHVRPEQVVEVAVDGAQTSTRYPGGVALRFARVRRYRDDKSAADADTIEAVRTLLP